MLDFLSELYYQQFFFWLGVSLALNELVFFPSIGRDQTLINPMNSIEELLKKVRCEGNKVAMFMKS